MLRRNGFVLSVRIFLLFSFPIGSPQLLAQQTINYATISGRVADPTDAVVPGAEIVAARRRQISAPVQRRTDQDGRFRFPYLRPGSYEISVRRTRVRGNHTNGHVDRWHGS